MVATVVVVLHLLEPVEAGLADCLPTDPVSKSTVCEMDHVIVDLGAGWKNYSAWYAAMEPYWTPDFIYTPALGINETRGLKEWYYGEYADWSLAFPEVFFNQMIFAGSNTTATSKTYAKGVWKAPLGPLQPTQQVTSVRICDFYLLDGPRIQHNWMMIDMLDLLRQAGKTPLKLSGLPQGIAYPPQSMDGIPAPISNFVTAKQSGASEALLAKLLAAEWDGQLDSAEHWAADMVWYGPTPWGMARGTQEYVKHFLQPFHAAFTEPKLEVDARLCEGTFCAVHGHFHGRHVAEWLGHKASGQRVSLAVGMHFHIVDGRVIESWALFDIPGMFQQSFGINILAQ